MKHPPQSRRKYTVYDNRTDMPIAVCATSEECAEAMGVKVATFHSAISNKRWKRWTVIKEGKCAELLVEDGQCGDL
jgi:hypothetical protein